MSDVPKSQSAPIAPDQLWINDICTWGFCWCGEPRRGRTFYDVDLKQWRMEMSCYAGHGGD